MRDYRLRITVLDHRQRVVDLGASDFFRRQIIHGLTAVRRAQAVTPAAFRHVQSRIGARQQLVHGHRRISVLRDHADTDGDRHTRSVEHKLGVLNTFTQTLREYNRC